MPPSRPSAPRRPASAEPPAAEPAARNVGRGVSDADIEQQDAPTGAGLPDYLKEAFLFRWNLLFFLGSTAAAAMTPIAPVLLPLVAAGELTYLTGLVSIPRFRAAIDAKVHAESKGGATRNAPSPPPMSLITMLEQLPADARTRFQRLHARCVEMRAI